MNTTQETTSPRKGYQLRSATMEFERFRSAMPSIPQGLPPRIPAPSHRHGAPSGPWPFLDIDDRIDPEKLKNNEPSPPPQVCDHLDAEKCKGCWSGYPQSLFPNWTPSQQRRSRISKIVEKRTETCIIRYVDVAENGEFHTSRELPVTYGNKDAHWEFMRSPRPSGTRLRALFLENLSGPVLQMVGTKYNVEPFFFSSSLGWIPARYQEEVKPTQSDHITITLTFIRTMHNPTTAPPGETEKKSTYDDSILSDTERPQPDQVIDTQAPLFVRSSDHILVPDLLALHMVRSPAKSTIISYHPSEEYRATTAASLHKRLSAAGRSVYWNNIFRNHDDPTFVFLSILWYAAYAWDEAFEVLYKHICYLESRVIRTNDMNLTQELHVVQAHLLHYASLLEDFRKSVQFVLDTPYPALDNPALYTEEEKHHSQELMQKECDNLKREIHRLERSRVMQGKRLRNVMDLGFSSVNIEDSKRMQDLTKAAVKDSEAMKQIAYLTMFFLPASLVAGVFGMNVREVNPGTLGTIPHYLATAITLTVLTIWVIVALQYHPGHPRRAASEGGMEGYEDDTRLLSKSALWNTLGRIGWPVVLALELFERRKESASARSRTV
ncbi:putative corA-like Mg2+ transporter protein [Lyophyllum shimeji]|uniref:CorA-like Mg2+ transporter protein n=1 Tax=Lyophyllum shimeji TaxID=47721 RepID=A0A9P3PTQ2_LYOSH|nr:putative corA-like Mg2+ transporter protein [Lyophyllum shimeji]